MFYLHKNHIKCEYLLGGLHCRWRVSKRVFAVLHFWFLTITFRAIGIQILHCLSFLTDLSVIVYNYCKPTAIQLRPQSHTVNLLRHSDTYKPPYLQRSETGCHRCSMYHVQYKFGIMFKRGSCRGPILKGFLWFIVKRVLSLKEIQCLDRPITFNRERRMQFVVIYKTMMVQSKIVLIYNNNIQVSLHDNVHFWKQCKQFV